MSLNKSFFASLAITLSLSTFSFAATLVDFKPLPSSSLSPEFVFAGPPAAPQFQSGPGAQGNGDGNLPILNQTPGGLDSETPFIGFPPVPGIAPNLASTEFRDSTLVFTGLTATIPATNFFGTFIQPLGTGTFSLLSSDPDGPGGNPPALLLTGTIGNATIVGAGSSGAVLNSGSVNYTGGLIYNALVAAGANPNNNDMSFSMVDVTPNFGIVGSGFIGNFTANGTGLFSYTPIPEPGTAVLVVFALAGAIFGRRR